MENIDYCFSHNSLCFGEQSTIFGASIYVFFLKNIEDMRRSTPVAYYGVNKRSSKLRG